MKRFLVILLMVALLPCAIFAEGQGESGSASVVSQSAQAYFADYPGSRIAPTTAIIEKMEMGDDVFILDIRTAADYEAGHLKGAYNAAWGPELAAALEWLPDDQEIFVNCYSGQTAGQTVAVLNIAGLQATSIKYGWKLGITKTEGYEAYVETTVNATPEASGSKLDPEVKMAAAEFFNTLKADPETPSNIIGAAALKAKMDAEEEMVIISVRSAEDFAKGHVEGAINIPFGAGMQEAFADLPMDKKVFVYCYSGQTAGQTVGVLNMMGFDAASIKSGMGTAGTGATGWGNEGLPIVQ